MSRRKMSWADALNVAFMLAVCFTMLYPFVHIFSLSLSSPLEAAKGGFMFYPRDFGIDTYRGLLKDTVFWSSYLNIVIVTVVGVAGSLTLTAAAAYVLSVPYYPLRRAITIMITFTMFFNAGIVPSYLLMNAVGLMDTWIPLWLPGVLAAFNIILLINFFRQVPGEIRESAFIDGASEFQILFRIVFPLSKPVLATVGLFLAVMYWNDWFNPYIFVNDPDKYTLPVVLRRYLVNNEMDGVSAFIKSTEAQALPEQIRSTIILVSILPTLVIYPFIQRYFVKGVSLGAIKG